SFHSAPTFLQVLKSTASIFKQSESFPNNNALTTRFKMCPAQRSRHSSSLISRLMPRFASSSLMCCTAVSDVVVRRIVKHEVSDVVLDFVLFEDFDRRKCDILPRMNSQQFW